MFDSPPSGNGPAEGLAKTSPSPVPPGPAFPGPTFPGKKRNGAFDIARMMNSYGLNENDLEEIRRLGETFLPRIDDYLEAFYAWLETQIDLHTYFPDVATLKRARNLQGDYWRSLFRADVNDDYVNWRRQVGEVHGRIQLPVDVYLAGIGFSVDWFAEALFHQKSSAKAAVAALHSLTKLIRFDTAIVLDALVKRNNEIMAAQSQSLLELSTPVIKVWSHILLLPLIGVIDTERAAQITEHLLEAVVTNESRVAILDVTGVPVLDTHVAHHLMKTVSAVKMLGAEVIITGIKPETAQTLANLGVDFSFLRTCGSLHAAVSQALGMIGAKIVLVKENGK